MPLVEEEKSGKLSGNPFAGFSRKQYNKALPGANLRFASSCPRVRRYTAISDWLSG